MYQMPPVTDPEKLQRICNFINDMTEDECDIIATPGQQIIAWRRTFVDPRTQAQSSAPVDRSEAYYRLNRAGYAPRPLIEAAVQSVG